MPARWKAALNVFLWFAASLALLGGSAWLGACVVSWFRGGPPDRSDNLAAGLICGLTVWLFVAVFHLGKETIVVSVGNRAEFFQNIKAILDEMGYCLISQSNEYLGTKPGFGAMLLGDGVQVHVEGSAARIVGPKVSVEALQTRLRYKNHLTKVQRRVESAKRSQPECFVRHAEISATLDPAQWDDFRTHVLAPLAEEGPVRIDVHLLTAPSSGVRDSVVESARAWLEVHAYESEVRKDFVQRFDPMLAETQPLP